MSDVLKKIIQYSIEEKKIISTSLKKSFLQKLPWFKTRKNTRTSYLTIRALLALRPSDTFFTNRPKGPSFDTPVCPTRFLLSGFFFFFFLETQYKTNLYDNDSKLLKRKSVNIKICLDNK